MTIGNGLIKHNGPTSPAPVTDPLQRNGLHVLSHDDKHLVPTGANFPAHDAGARAASAARPAALCIRRATSTDECGRACSSSRPSPGTEAACYLRDSRCSGRSEPPAPSKFQPEVAGRAPGCGGGLMFHQISV